MQAARAGLEPGWYLVIAWLATAVVASAGWRGAVADLRGPRLNFGIREGDGFVGQGLAPIDVRWLAASPFTGP